MQVWIPGSASVLLCFLLEGWVWRSVAEELPEVMTQTTEMPCRSGDFHSCYFCKTNDHQADDYCSDPFNTTLPQLDFIQCSIQDFCTKWVVRLSSGAIQTTRTCSKKMELDLKIYPVCMSESGSDEGHLCFCEGDLCNDATALTAMTSWGIYVIATSLGLSAALRWFPLAWHS